MDTADESYFLETTVRRKKERYVMSDLHQRIRLAVRELQEIKGELERKSSTAKDDPELAEALTLETLEEFKGALDHMRHMIWPFLIALQQNSAENVEYALQLYRMQRVREMLKSLKTMDRMIKDEAPMQLFLSEIARLIEESRANDRSKLS